MIEHRIESIQEDFIRMDGGIVNARAIAEEAIRKSVVAGMGPSYLVIAVNTLVEEVERLQKLAERGHGKKYVEGFTGLSESERYFK